MKLYIICMFSYCIHFNNPNYIDHISDCKNANFNYEFCAGVKPISDMIISEMKKALNDGYKMKKPNESPDFM